MKINLWSIDCWQLVLLMSFLIFVSFTSLIIRSLPFLIFNFRKKRKRNFRPYDLSLSYKRTLTFKHTNKQLLVHAKTALDTQKPKKTKKEWENLNQCFDQKEVLQFCCSFWSASVYKVKNEKGETKKKKNIQNRTKQNRETKKSNKKYTKKNFLFTCFGTIS